MRVCKCNTFPIVWASPVNYIAASSGSHVSRFSSSSSSEFTILILLHLASSLLTNNLQLCDCLLCQSRIYLSIYRCRVQRSIFCMSNARVLFTKNLVNGDSTRLVNWKRNGLSGCCICIFAAGYAAAKHLFTWFEHFIITNFHYKPKWSTKAQRFAFRFAFVLVARSQLQTIRTNM